MLKLTIEIDVSGFKRKDQLPFAAALALTRTAQAAQAEVRKELPQRFTIRNNWTARGIQITRAEKSNLEAVVFSANDYMILQETGGTKLPRGRSLAVPEDVRRAKSGIISTGQKPEALRSSPKTFRATIGGVDGLWQRLAGHKGRRRKGERTLKLLWIFKPSVPIAPRFGFADTVRNVVRLAFPDQFRQAFARAIATAR